MYDARNEPHEFVGADREEAVEKAARFFDAPEGELKIHELKTGDVYGSADRTVLVAALRDRTPPQP